jgi:hypothetical protein
MYAIIIPVFIAPYCLFVGFVQWVFRVRRPAIELLADVRVPRASEHCRWRVPEGDQLSTCADMQITVRVNEECIVNGKREDSNCCAVARAIKEQVPGVERSSVDVTDYIRFDVGRDSYEFQTPKDVETFIHEFDGGENPEPISFALDLNSVDAWVVDDT